MRIIILFMLWLHSFITHELPTYPWVGIKPIVVQLRGQLKRREGKKRKEKAKLKTEMKNGESKENQM